ncbi:MAG: hypothetical protein AAGD96_13090 [Chloroflexota bacterium]
MEFSITDFFELVNKALEQIFGPSLPDWVSSSLSWGVLLIAFLVAVYAALWLISGIIGLVQDNLIPRLYDKEKVRRSERRKMFADHIEYRIRQLNIVG